MTKPISALQALTETLRQRLGTEGYRDDDEAIELMSTDIWSRGERPAFVAAPANLEELRAVVGAAYEEAVPLNPRGGGMSYTGGYTADREGVGILDLRRMDRIIEINERDMYVTVEAGCTWKTLYEALKPKRLRTPFFGPLSGISSTVGGGVSQNNAFFGAGAYGPTSDSVIALTVVLADGSVVRTGTAGTRGAAPFFRHYGPDLAGLFLSDAGALGFKAEITLRLIPEPGAEAYASFEFGNREACARALEEAGRLGLAAEIFGFDPALTAVRMKRASLAEDAKALGEVIRKQKGLFRGLKESVKIAAAGRGFLGGGTWSLHMTTEGLSEASAEEKLQRLKSICRRHDGREVANTIPKVIRSSPFTPLNNMLGPEGERWVPIHGIVPMSKGPETWAKISDAFAEMADRFEKHQISTGFLVTTLSNNGYLVEPVFLWPDERYAVHDASVETPVLDRATAFPRNPEANDAVRQARARVLEIFEEAGGAHFQIGRAYPYLATREPGTEALLKRIKALLDPKGTVNPGALGLEPAAGPIPVRNPRTGSIDGSLAPISPVGLRRTAERLRAAGREWGAISMEERGKRLLKLASAIEERREQIARALSADTGRRRVAGFELDGVIASIRGWTAQIPMLKDQCEWKQGISNPQIRHRSQLVPYGLVGVISPWNFPLTLSMIDTVPALLAGCPVIVKPSEVTPRFAAPVREAVEAAGLGDLLAIVDGDGRTGAALVGEVDAVCFTGSVPTGRKVAVLAAERLIPAFLELGGKDPLIVTGSADIEPAADAALRGSVLATGQACQSIERIYVHRASHDAFVEALVSRAERARLNTPDIGNGEIGPLIFENQAAIIEEQVRDALEKGARCRTGGEIEHHGGGLWLRPTVLTDVHHGMRIMQEETFGPVMPVMAFDDIEEAVTLANDSQYGLSAAVFAGSLEEAEAIGRRLEAGAVSLNDAALTSLFYEAEKQSFKFSGLGASRMGPSGLLRFLRKKALIAQHGQPAPLGAFSEDG